MRSSAYDDLLSAETRAAKNLKGVHSKKDYPVHRVADISQVISPSFFLFLFLIFVVNHGVHAE